MLLVALMSAISAGPAVASTSCNLYAGPLGSDSNPGTIDLPLRTAQKLVDSLEPGEVGCLLAGTYAEDVTVRRGGLPGLPTTLTSAPGARATVIGRFWVADSANDVVVSDLILNGRNASRLPSPTVNGDRVQFLRNEVTNDHTAIGFVIGSDVGWGVAIDVVIDGNHIHDNGVLPATNHEHGIYVESARNTRITNNFIYDNADRGIQLYPDAQATYIANNVIDGNGTGILFSGAGGIASDGTQVVNNIVSNASLRYNIESWYPDGNPVGTDNIVEQNCVWNGARGNIAEDWGYVARSNLTADPLFVNQASDDFRLDPGSPCAGKGPQSWWSPSDQASAPGETTGNDSGPQPVFEIIEPPTNTVPPTISGEPRVGQTLSASAGTWGGTAPIAIRYRWLRCWSSSGARCTPISGAASSSYTVSRQDVSRWIAVQVTATNDAGSQAATAVLATKVRR